MTLSFARIAAIMFKEIRQAVRDPTTLAIMIMMPLIQMIIFGYAINGDPRHMPLAIELNDHSAFTRSIDAALRNTTFFDVTQIVSRPGEADALVRQGKVQFVVTIPADFTRDLVRGDRPQLLLTADATDPAATGNALAAIGQATNQAIARDLNGPLSARLARDGPFEPVLHRSYNPEGITNHNTVPGLLAVVLTMTMVIITALAVTREVEQGTMENLLAFPLRPIEVMIGKIAPYMVIGLIQTGIVLLAARYLFDVPLVGSVGLIFGSALLFITVSLALGFTISTFATSQIQTMQISFFYVLPSILMSGFIFPFQGMPFWAQCVGTMMPTTHFMRVIRGVMLKGWTLVDALPELGILSLMLVVLGSVAVMRYRDTVG